MLAYVTRRLAYSIPVLLIASFLLFAFVRITFDPTARLRASRDVDASGAADYARHLFLPVMTLTVQIVASWSRYERASMLDTLSADYVRAAKAKGLRPRTVIWKHAFRNALLPLVTVMALDIGVLFGGLIITEQIFSI